MDVLRAVLSGNHEIPDDFIRHHETGDGVSTRYFKQVMLISEVNGRISELRGKGHEIETSAERDEYGFAYHRLRPAQKAESPQGVCSSVLSGEPIASHNLLSARRPLEDRA